ncbi:Primosomal protein N' [Alphaproteobacteria bacterium]
MAQLVTVLLPLALDQCFTYSFNDERKLVSGQLVVVPFRNTKLVGMVVENAIPAENMLDKKLREIDEVLDLPPISLSTQQFMKWVADYNMAYVGMVLKMMLSISKAEYRKIAKLCRTQNNIPALILSDATLYTKCEVSLSIAQQKVVDVIKNDIGSCKKNAIYVLDGVTGSGKTEVYLDIAKDILASGGQVLMLVPEILLTAQLTSRFQERINTHKLFSWHSAITNKQKCEIWYGVQQGRINFIIGARSALFLPFSNLHFIVVDEEHDSSFKQEEGVVYNARDMAVMRANIENIPIILSSATPSTETIYNVRQNKYSYFYLEQRYSGVELPKVLIVDMKDIVQKKTMQRNGPPSASWIHTTTQQYIADTIKAKKQAMLFINRRGYAPVSMCTGCGNKIKCKNCQFWLVYHKYKNILQCHYCGISVPCTPKCEQCSSEGNIITYGPGVEKIEEEIRFLFPEAKIEIATSDTITSPAKAREMIDNITHGDVDILIGTQLLAKGLHFNKLQLVVVIDANPHYLGADIRVLEKTYQLLHQVMGRAGRGKEQGQIILQTHEPDNALLKYIAAYNREGFMELELQNRQIAKVPPFTRLAMITISAKDEIKLLTVLKQLSSHIPTSNDNLLILGPAPAPLMQLRNFFRYRFIIRADKKINVQKTIKEWLSNAKLPPNFKIKIDIDPHTFT